ncbi:Sushi/SCR/CCP,domain-containing protein isoform 3 [Schistosoma japonicum]|uniref:Sushi/SCR/CCP,domain-containing protein isoform 3 n=1 Tax=Schistosoma japonicum TaxID=6182 RepID=A0A4Z2D6A3_SCHJA|nr:Sushi/SCR/CCP domain-containing protein [Schistosoma japonicum]TNN12022.1 Sushi/SCR/CCP,domain-containing protein isoform 3 [Schistosoma japonicum]
MLLIIIFVIPLYAIPLDFPCYDETWTYSNLTGKCYKPILGAQKLTFSDASYACKIHLQNISEVSINLIQFFDEDEANAVVDLLSRNGFKETIWIGANRSDAKQPFVWYTDGSTALFSYIDWSEGTNSGNCIEFSYSTQPIPGTDKWSVTKIVDNKPCDLTRSFICEHKVPLCTNPQGGFNSTTMIFKPPIMAPRSVVQVLCAPGTLPDPIVPGSRLSGFEVDLSLPRGSYKCTGKRFNNNPNSEDPLKFQPQLFYSGYSLTTCSYVKCPLYPELMENIENKPQVPVGSDSLIYDYGQNITLQCSRGYVSFQNPNSTLATMICAQASATFNQGLWDPENYQACIAVRCNQKELDDMIPKYAKLVSARNRITEQVFGSHQVNQFYSYGNVISIRCNPGYLFNDRTTEKSVSCELVPGSNTIGEYRGYSGTLLPLPTTCEEATCLYEQAVIQPDSNMQPYFIVMKSTIDVMNLTKHSGDPYPRGTVIRYFCKDGYESINQNSELNITCGNYGQWTPQLIGCIARIEKVPVSLAGRFYSPPEEAESASKLSSIMFIMVFIFLGLILLLDLATIGRDFKQIRSNIKLQKRRLNHLKNKSKVG